MPSIVYFPTGYFILFMTREELFLLFYGYMALLLYCMFCLLFLGMSAIFYLCFLPFIRWPHFEMGGNTKVVFLLSLTLSLIFKEPSCAVSLYNNRNALNASEPL